MAGWVAYACRKPLSREDCHDTVGNPPPPPTSPPRAVARPLIAVTWRRHCVSGGAVRRSPPLLCPVTYPRAVWLPVPLPGVMCPRDRLVSVCSLACPRCLHLSLTFPAGFCVCWSAARSRVCSHCYVTPPRMSLYQRCMRPSERRARLRAKHPPTSVTPSSGWRWKANYMLSAICKPC